VRDLEATIFCSVIGRQPTRGYRPFGGSTGREG
jgi:hypothetical protein